MMEEIIQTLLNYEEVGMDMLRRAKIRHKILAKIRSPLDKVDSAGDDPTDIEFCRIQLDQIRDMIDRVRDYRPTVTIEVRGGVAEVTDCPEGIEVEIIDHDNEAAGESSRTEIKETTKQGE